MAMDLVLRLKNQMARVPTPENFDSSGRSYAYSATMQNYKARKPKRDEYGALTLERDTSTVAADAWGANLITSYSNGTGGHKPVIDLDFPARLIPSTTPGHYHLYIDEAISWNAYVQILNALLNAGLIQQAWYEGAINNGYTAVRPPWVHKGQKPLAQRETVLPGFIEDGPIILNEDDSRMVISALRERHDRMYAQVHEELKAVKAELEEAREIIKAYHDVDTTARAPLAWG